MSYKTKIDQLLETPRIYWMELNAVSNNVAGLIDLCKKYIKKGDHGVEHGCFSGVSSRAIALHCGKLDCVDPWSWQEVKEAEKMFDGLPHRAHQTIKCARSSHTQSPPHGILRQLSRGNISLEFTKLITIPRELHLLKAVRRYIYA
jgi:hypothetical protein